MRHGLYLPNFGPFGSAAAMAEMAAAGENAGWEGAFVWDHVVRHEGDLDVVDPWVALAAMAYATSRVALGPLITPLPRRRPWNVAKSAVSLDHLSGGRAVLGVGLGSIRGPELTAFGEETDPKVRGDMLDEGLQIVRAAWSGEPVEHAGAHYRVDGIRFLPRPVGRIPLWAATESVRGRPVRRAASLDGVFPIGVGPGDIAGLLSALRGAGAPRDGFDVVVASHADDAEAWEGTGVTWWLRWLPWEEDLDVSRRIVASGPPR